ncbi:MAG TPA: tetraacyldisaccharide 4'-kinase, partial [Ramlibacter sp.]|nr:tetraacyldisaccharide 4'-kinase [Ramlibacter sp.]
MRETLQRAWLRRGPLACVLWPFSIVFGILAAIRRAAYRAGFLKVTRLPVPVVIVGNVIVGGSGKTPVVIALVNHLRARGLEVGVVSRGYGRSTPGCREVRADSDVREAGDEPLLIARACAA